MNAIQAIYKPLTKKQKGLLLDAICNQADFTKSKEWVRKYIAGAYPNRDLHFEQLALLCAENLGFEMSIKTQQEVIEQLEVHIVEQKFSIEREEKETLSASKVLVPVNELEAILIEGLNANISSKIGSKWFIFLRRCQKNLFNRLNPFIEASNLLKILQEQEVQDYPEYPKVKELNELFQQSKIQSDFLKNREDWERFSQLARHKYYINPFIYLQQII